MQAPVKPANQPTGLPKPNPAYRRAILSLDFGDRREVWQLLQRLEPHQRTAWLTWCCSLATGDIRVVSSTGLSREVYWDWIWLCYQCGVSTNATRAELENRVRELSNVKFLIPTA
jgi:hypothetical protein